jgi:hypothetical protein
MEKPFVMNYKEGSRNLYAAVNDLNLKYGVPFYMIETILQEALYEVKIQSNLEYENAVQSYTAEQQNIEKDQMTLEEAAANE